MHIANLTYRALCRSRRRTLAAILISAGALFVFSVLRSVPDVANEFLGASASPQRLVCHHKAGVSYLLPDAYPERIRALPHIVSVEAENWYGGSYENPYDEFPNTSVDADQIDKMFPDWGISQSALQSFKILKNACLVGNDLIRRYHWKMGQTITLHGTNYPFDVHLQIVGTLGDKAAPSYLVFRRDYFKELAGDFPLIDDIWVRVDSPSNVPQAIKNIDSHFADSIDATRTELESDFVKGFFSNLQDLFSITSWFAFLVIGAAAVVVTIITAAENRRYVAEFDALHSMGFSARWLRLLLWSEATVPWLIGGVLGAIACQLSLGLLGFGLSSFGQLGVIRMPGSVLMTTLGLLLATALPVGWLASRSTPLRSAS